MPPPLKITLVRAMGVDRSLLEDELMPGPRKRAKRKRFGLKITWPIAWRYEDLVFYQWYATKQAREKGRATHGKKRFWLKNAPIVEDAER